MAGFYGRRRAAEFPGILALVRPHPRIPAAAVALLASACAVTVSRDEVDELLRAYEIRTAVMEPRFTVMSNFSATRTADVVAAMREELPRVEELFGLRLEERLSLYLLPSMKAEIDEDEGGYLLRFENRPGYQAYTDHRSKIVVLLNPDVELPNGQTVFALGERRDYRDSLRHELTHLCAHRVREELPTWLDEGLAHYVGRSGRLGARAALPSRLPLSETDHAIPLADLLDWREDGSRIVAGLESSRDDLRRVGLAFVAFLLEREPAGQPLAATVERLASLDRARLLELEPAFRLWLAS